MGDYIFVLGIIMSGTDSRARGGLASGYLLGRAFADRTPSLDVLTERRRADMLGMEHRHRRGCLLRFHGMELPAECLRHAAVGQSSRHIVAHLKVEEVGAILY